MASQLEQNVPLIFSEGIPFRATRMWGELVRDFEAGVRLKKKRWRMKYYNDCFSGSEAIEWMHEYLKTNPNYGSNVARNQAEQLCQKFLKQNVIEDILPRCQNTKPAFEVNRFYSFVRKSISKRERKLKPSDSKENDLSKHSKIKGAPTRKPTPFLKRRSSFSGNTRDTKRPFTPFKERKGLQNLANETNTGKIMEDKTNKLPSASASTLSRKWKSHLDLSLIPENSFDESPVMEIKSLINNPINAEASTGLSNKQCPITSDFSNKQCPITSDFSNKQCPITSDFSNKQCPTVTDCKATPGTSVEKEIHVSHGDECNVIWKDVCLERLERVLNVDSLTEILDCDALNWKNVMENVKSDSREVKEAVPRWLISAMKCLIHSGSNSEDVDTGPDYPGIQKDVFNTICEHFELIPEPLIPLRFLEVFTKISGLATKCKLSAIRALQYTLLLLEKRQKQQLQLLLRFMIKISKNQQLTLSDDLSTGELAMRTFVPCIFSEDKEKAGLTEILGIRITSFIMDNFCEVFKVPIGLQFQVEQRMTFIRRNVQNDVKYKTQSGLSSGNVAFCERVTSEEFAEQKQFVTQRCLEELLNCIVNDEKMNEKERKKKLKQFQKLYPEIYFNQFPGDGLSIASQQTSVGKLRKAIKPLGLIKKLR